MVQKNEKFLLDCIRANSEPDFREAAGHLRKNTHKTDWTKVSREQYAVFLPIYLEAKRLHEDLGIPRETERTIETAYLLTSQRIEEIRRAAVELAKHFNQAGIELLFLKGTALLATVYKNDIGIRPMQDIDVLIKKADLPQTERILKQLGYSEDYARLSQSWKFSVSRDYCEKQGVHYVYYRGPIVLELHCNIHTHPKRWLQLDHLADMTQKAMLGDAQITGPKTEAAVLIACTDFVKDFSRHLPLYARASREMKEKIFYTALFFLREIKRILQYGKQGMDWERLMSLTRELHNEYEVYTLLLMAQKMVRADIPEYVVQKMKRRFSVALYHWLCQSVTHGDCARLFLDRHIVRQLTAERRPLGFAAPNIRETLKSYLHLYCPKEFFAAKTVVRRIRAIFRGKKQCSD